MWEGVVLTSVDPSNSEKAVLALEPSSPPALHLQKPLEHSGSILDQGGLCSTQCPPRNLGRKSLHHQGHQVIVVGREHGHGVLLARLMVLCISI